MLKIAVAKGRTAEKVQKLLKETEEFSGVMDLTTRKLIFTDETKQLQFILVKPSDLPTYVESGAADIGIVGKDILLEKSYSVYELFDMKISSCMLALAGPADSCKGSIKKIATKYPVVAADYFRRRSEHVDIVKLDGSVELAPLLGLSEAIVDIVESGETLRENGLVVYEKICDISARVIANKASYKLKNDAVNRFINCMRELREAK